MSEMNATCVKMVFSLLLHMEEEALHSIEDSAPDVLALQKRRIEELRSLHSQAILSRGVSDA